MFERILVVCDGNICRSPTVAAMLAAARPDKRISSAGLVGLEGHDMEPTARDVAAAQARLSLFAMPTISAVFPRRSQSGVLTSSSLQNNTQPKPPSLTEAIVRDGVPC